MEQPLRGKAAIVTTMPHTQDNFWRVRRIQGWELNWKDAYRCRLPMGSFLHTVTNMAE